MRRTTVILLLWTMISGTVAAQEKSKVTMLSEDLRTYSDNHPVEKVYLHHAKHTYAKGDILWFKAYVVDGIGHRLMPSSEILYADLIHHTTGELYQEKIPLKNGVGKGSLLLADTLRSGPYLLRAYTGHMKNYDEGFFYTDRIFLVDRHDEDAHSGEEPTFDLQLFPEGGDLVSGVFNRVGVKCVNDRQKGIPFTGILLDDKGNTMAEFASNRLGFSSFFITPSSDAQYKIQVKTDDGVVIEQPLPPPVDHALNLFVNNSSEDDLEITLQGTKEYFKQTENDIAYLLIQSSGYPYYVIEGDFKKKRGFVARIPKSDLPEGLLHLTVFNGQGLPEAERLVFAHHPWFLARELSTGQTYYRRDRVRLQLQIQDSTGSPLQGDFSLAVMDQSQNPKGAWATNIGNYLLLDAELGGYIEQPGFYFDPSNEARSRDLDMLLLTQGWRRFTWKQVEEEKDAEPQFPFERNLKLKGYAVYQDNQEGLRFKKLSLSQLSTGTTVSAQTNVQGYFTASLWDFYGYDKIIPNFNAERNSKVTIRLVDEIPAVDKTLSLYTEEQPHLAQKVINSMLIAQSYQPTDSETISEKFLAKQREAQRLKMLLYSDDEDELHYLQEYQQLNDLGEVFTELIPGVKVRKRNKSTREVRIYSNTERSTFEDQPLFLVDSIPTYDTDLVLSMDVADIESIGVLRSRLMRDELGTMAENGVIIINTNSDKFTITLNKGIIKNFKGFSTSREFYSPKYDNVEAARSRIPDLRHLLHWEPDVEVSDNGEIEVSFYTSDVVGKFIIDLQGVTTDGNPFVGSGSFEVVLDQ